METRIKKELVLEGLQCNDCLMEIERETNRIKHIKTHMDFLTQTLTAEIRKLSDLEVLKEIIYLIAAKDRHEITINESPKKHRSFTVKNLSCANCALKIENKIKKENNIDGVSLDFATGKLIVNSDKSLNANAIEAIVKKIEPDAYIQEDQEEIEEERRFLGKEIALIAISTAALLFTIFVSMTFWVMLALYLVNYIFIGGKILIKALKNVFHGNIFDENFLMAVATFGALLIFEYPEAVAVMLLYRLGELLQDLAVDRSKKSISKLINIKSDYATLLIGNDYKKVGLKEVKIGDWILVKAGEKVPLDGVVVEGNSYVDTSNLTGESTLRAIGPNSEILSGFINQNGVLKIKVTKTEAESTVSKILNLVENATAKKAQTEKFITKFARVYTPIVVAAAGLLAVVPPFFFEGEFSDWLYRALIFLVISCPCALVISIPIGFFGGIGAASKQGIIVKGGNYLEALNDLKLAVFDKTGTLTKGVFTVKSIQPADGFSAHEVLRVAATIENMSNHPIALSIMKEYKQEITSEMKNYEEHAGYGITAVLDGKRIAIGNSRLMDQESIVYKKADINDTVVYLSIDGNYAGTIIIGDEMKPDAYELGKKLKRIGIETVMLTGDTREAAEAIGKEVFVSDVYAGLLPHQKVEVLEQLLLKKQGKVAFIGDGINDAPVLARSDIGIAMGALGSDAAIEAADIVIMNDEPSKLITAIEIAKRTKRIVWGSILFALGVKFLFLLLGALSIANLWDAVFADVGVSVLAVLNAMRIMRIKKKKI